MDALPIFASTMIKEGLKCLQLINDVVREEERDLAAEDVELIPSDHNSDSEL